MKISNIISIGLVALTMSACSAYDPHENAAPSKINSAADVVVSMEDLELQFPEDRVSNATYCKIPVVVAGNTNGAVKVQVNISATSENGATEGENFIVTSKTIYIPAGAHEGYIEFYQKGDRVINEDRQFVATIEKVEGAQIGTVNSTLVTLVDNDLIISQLYPTIEGDWIWSYAGDLGEGEDPVYVVMPEVGTDDYDNLKFQIIGLLDPNSSLTAVFDYDAVSQQAVITVPYGQYLLSASFTGLGAMDVYNGYYTEDTGWSSNGAAIAYSNRTTDDINRLSFTDDMWLGIANPGTSSVQYIWCSITDMKLVRP